jgi:hypothetical protein
MLPPMFRIRLKRLVALPIFSRGISPIVAVVSGRTAAETSALKQLRPEISVPACRLSFARSA